MIIRKMLTLEVPEKEGPRETGEIEIRISTSGGKEADRMAHIVWLDIASAILLEGNNRSLTITEW